MHRLRTEIKELVLQRLLVLALFVVFLDVSAYMALDQSDASFKWLERAYKERLLDEASQHPLTGTREGHAREH